MNKKIFLSIVLFVCILQSCKNDFEVNAPYTENAAIYGVLNPDTSTQVIRINKSFLGKGNAKSYAQIPDSINYGKELSVVIERYRNGALVATIPLIDTIITTNNSGDFSNAQKIYITRKKITGSSDTTSKLVVKNAKTGKTYTAVTDMVGSIFFQESQSVRIYSVDYSPVPFVISFQIANNAKKYMVVLRFNYVEEVAGKRYYKYYDYVLYADPVNVQGTYLGTPVLMGDDYYRSIANYVTATATPGYVPHVSKRYVDINGNMQVFFTGYNDILNTYIEVNKPSSGLSQDKLTYTNILGGFGIFASKNSAKYFKARPLSPESLNELTTRNQNTNDLDFEAIPNP